MATNKETRKIARDARKSGFDVQQTRSGHYKIQALREKMAVYKQHLSGALEAIRRAQATNVAVAEDTLTHRFAPESFDCLR